MEIDIKTNRPYLISVSFENSYEGLLSPFEAIEIATKLLAVAQPMLDKRWNAEDLGL